MRDPKLRVLGASALADADAHGMAGLAAELRRLELSVGEE